MTYTSRFVEQYPSSENTHYNDNYPPGYDEATRCVLLSLIGREGLVVRGGG